MTEKINPEDLVPLDLFTDDFPVHVDIAYASDENLLFGERIYRPDARLWLHGDLAEIILLASKLCTQRHNLHFILYDGLRTTDAQAAMMRTQRVIENPEWLEEPRLLSPPGAGAHPRGMAIDLTLAKPDGALIDMGTPFDYLAKNPTPEHNPAHREYAGRWDGNHDEIQKNRTILNTCVEDASNILGRDIVLLPQEWWDFRFAAEQYRHFAPLSDQDLPAIVRMVNDQSGENEPHLDEGFYREKSEMMKEKILNVISEISAVNGPHAPHQDR